jgi:hypothetical protein
MSIAPVEGFPLSGSGQSGTGSLANAKVRSSNPKPRHKSDEAEERNIPFWEFCQNKKPKPRKRVPVPYELPQDVVEVHQDS